jgi:hypothetical protein
MHRADIREIVAANCLVVNREIALPWFYRRQNNGDGLGRFPVRLLVLLRLGDPIFTDCWRKIG